jgi:hypothetical protein
MGCRVGHAVLWFDRAVLRSRRFDLYGGFGFRLRQHSIGSREDQVPLPVLWATYNLGVSFVLSSLCQIFTSRCFHRSSRPFPNGTHRSEAIPMYSKMKSPISVRTRSV